jgi:uncharacterized protein YjiS (DUF1127 family)
MFNIFKLIKRMHLRARVTRELNSYSDRELSDMGISRCDIPCIAEKSVTQLY